jgi:hypothetical protein
VLVTGDGISEYERPQCEDISSMCSSSRPGGSVIRQLNLSAMLSNSNRDRSRSEMRSKAGYGGSVPTFFLGIDCVSAK